MAISESAPPVQQNSATGFPHDIARLDISVQQPSACTALKAPHSSIPISAAWRAAQGLCHQKRRKRLAVNEIGPQPDAAFMQVHSVDGNYIRMTHLGGKPRLAHRSFGSPASRIDGAPRARLSSGCMPHTRTSQPTRRAFLSAALATALPMRAQQAGNPRDVYAYAGCFTTVQRYARGDGIHVHRLDLQTGAWTHVQFLGNLVNPSFLVISRDQRRLYSVHGDETYATAFSVDRDTGHLTLLNRAQTSGRNGVHQAIDPSGRFLLVANYATGSVSVMPIRPDGGLADATQVVPLPGQPGPHRVEQTGSHPHQIVFDPSGRYVVVPDKGLDRVFVFVFDPATGTLTATVQGAAVARSNSGPRHAAFHPVLPVIWVFNEIGSTVVTYYWDSERGHLRPAQILPTLPPDYTGENLGAEIVVSSGGRFVYCSNCGHDSIAIFAADPATGLLTSAGWVSTQGRTPRFIGFDPSYRFLYAANEQSDTIVVFRVDAATGRLAPTGQVIRNASPVTIAFG